MSFSRAAAANVVPLLSRLVLAALLVPMGWTMLTSQATYRGEDLEWLRKLGVAESGDASLASFVAGQDGSGAGSVPPASEPPSGGGSDEAAPPVVGPGAVEPAEPPPSEIEPPASDVVPGESPATEGTATEPIPGDLEGVEARRLYTIAITFAKAAWPQPTLLAWSFAFLMLVGGSLTLLGLLVRLWGLLFAAGFGSLFWIQSWPVVASHWMLGLDEAAFLQIAAQAGLAVIAFSLVLTGGGRAGLDGAIFRRDGAPGPGEPAAS